MDVKNKSYILAIVAGILASLASVFGKLIFQRERIMKLCVSLLELLHISFNFPKSEFSEAEMTLLKITVWVIQAGCILMTISLNALMWSTFVEAMQKLTSSEAVVLNTGSNIIISGITGIMLFQETLSLRWWLGALFIVAGMGIIHSQNEPTNKKMK